LKNKFTPLFEMAHELSSTFKFGGSANLNHAKDKVRRYLNSEDRKGCSLRCPRLSSSVDQQT